MNQEFAFFPEAASTGATRVDALYFFLVGLSALLTLLVAALVVSFAIRYRKNNVVDRTPTEVSVWVELSWIVVPIPLLLGLFYWGSSVAVFLTRAPSDAMQIDVVAKQWMWKFQHASGRREIDTLHVPAGRAVRLRMISQDVIHSFYVPAFRVKQDVLPGRYSGLWFEATKPGEYRLYCAEYCGTNHSRMVGSVVVMRPSEFEDWLGGELAGDEPPAVAGRRLFEQMRCDTCHQGGGVQSRGPALENLFRSTVPLANGQTATADDEYLRESILRPSAKVVAGYQPIMPTYEGQISEEGVLALIAFIKSLAPEADAQP